MNLQYFSNLTNIDELKTVYRELTKKHHPDICGDDGTAMKVINAEYNYILKHGIKTKEGENLNADEIILEEEFRSIVEQTAILSGLITEICGKWLWFTGETYTHKATLKSLGCFFSKKKVAWYWRKEDSRTNSRGTQTLEEIRSSYGSIKISGKTQLCFA